MTEKTELRKVKDSAIAEIAKDKRDFEWATGVEPEVVREVKSSKDPLVSIGKDLAAWLKKMATASKKMESIAKQLVSGGVSIKKGYKFQDQLEDFAKDVEDVYASEFWRIADEMEGELDELEAFSD